LSVIAQYLLALKKLESWFVWMTVNVLAIYVYGTGGTMLLAAQYVLFLGNAFVGAWLWYKSYRDDKKEAIWGRV
jgi:nicotinamide mononucleotide transporter